MNETKLFVYNGPVMYFDNCVDQSWKAETQATSEKKARSNFIYRYKRDNDLVLNSKISLPGRIIEVV